MTFSCLLLSLWFAINFGLIGCIREAVLFRVQLLIGSSSNLLAPPKVFLTFELEFILAVAAYTKLSYFFPADPDFQAAKFLATF